MMPQQHDVPGGDSRFTYGEKGLLMSMGSVSCCHVGQGSQDVKVYSSILMLELQLAIILPRTRVVLLAGRPMMGLLWVHVLTAYVKINLVVLQSSPRSYHRNHSTLGIRRKGIFES